MLFGLFTYQMVQLGLITNVAEKRTGQVGGLCWGLPISLITLNKEFDYYFNKTVFLILFNRLAIC